MLILTFADHTADGLALKVETFLNKVEKNYLDEHVEVSFTSTHSGTVSRHYAWVINRQGGDVWSEDE